MSASDTAGALSCSGVCTIGKQPVNIPLTALQKKKFCAWECRGFPKTSGRKLSSPHAAQFIRARTRGRVMLTKYPAAFPVGQLVSQILTKYTLRYPECGFAPLLCPIPARCLSGLLSARRTIGQNQYHTSGRRLNGENSSILQHIQGNKKALKLLYFNALCILQDTAGN